MKKYAIVAYIVLILIILMSGFFIYKSFGKANDSDKKIEEKTLAEIKYMENQFQNIFNQFNNISFENYMIQIKETKKEDEEKQSSSSSSSSSQKSGSSKEESSGKSGSSESSDDNKQYNLKEKGVLTEELEPDWTQIKIDVEKIYTQLYVLNLDLYQTSANVQEISNFNQEYDDFTLSVKEENKEESLKKLSILYDYLPKFIENCTNDEKENVVIKTKSKIFKAYSMLDNEDWDSMSSRIDDAIQEFSKILININEKENINKYSANKANIMINELKNSIKLKEKEVFLIKYKNVLEELQNM